MPWWVWIIGGIAALTTGTAATLTYFRDSEFRGQKDQLAPELLTTLDTFRGRLAARLKGPGVKDVQVRVSPVKGAMVRRQGPEADSLHNADRWGEARAIDVLVVIITDTGAERAMTKAEAEVAREVAEAVGFTGIGTYPHWRPFPGLHLDVRPHSLVGGQLPDTWGGLPEPGGGQRYVAADTALSQWGRYA